MSDPVTVTKVVATADDKISLRRAVQKLNLLIENYNRLLALVESYH